MMNRSFSLLLPAIALGFCWLAGVQPAAAQIEVRIDMKRRLFIRYEPVVVTVQITNNAGRDVFLTDEPNKPWFGLEISTEDGSFLPPITKDYKLSPLLLENGKTVKRKIDITPLFPIDATGLYRVRGLVYSIAAGRYFGSNQIRFDVMEGRTIWSREYGVPDNMKGAGENRVVQLLSQRLPEKRLLYVRVSNPATGTIYCNHDLGRLATYVEEPQVYADAKNDIHILQLTAPKTFIYTQLDLNGNVKERKAYYDARTRPKLVRNEKGAVRVSGGSNTAPGDTAAGAAATYTMPKVSDRPAGLPLEE